jgi:uncharacterized membrane protein YhaH (DUF805 family)
MYWFIDPIKNHYADFSGRASRKQFWMFALGHTLFVFAWMLVVLVFFAASFAEGFDGGATVFMLPLVLGLFFLVWLGLFLVPSIAIQVRRLHDIGLSGWWYFISFVPYIGGLVLFIMSCLQSEQHTNKYGPNPYGIELGGPAAPMPGTTTTVTTTTVSTTTTAPAAQTPTPEAVTTPEQQ